MSTHVPVNETLFQTIGFEEFACLRTERALADVRALSEADLANEAFVAEIIAAWLLVPLSVDLATAIVAIDDAEILIASAGPDRVHGVRVTLTATVHGSLELLRVTPTVHDLEPLQCDIHMNRGHVVVVLEETLERSPTEHLRTERDRFLSHLWQWDEWIRTDVEGFNASVASAVRGAVEHRRSAVCAQDELNDPTSRAALGAEAQSSDSAPEAWKGTWRRRRHGRGEADPG
jgi:hypothetical protein